MQIAMTGSLQYIHNLVPLEIQALYTPKYLLIMNNYPPDILQSCIKKIY